MPLINLSSIQPEDKKLLAFDVDDTVCKSCQVMDEDLAIYLGIKSITHTLVFMSGTDCTELSRMVLTPITQANYSAEVIIAGGSGSRIIKMNRDGGTVLFQRSMSASSKLAILVALGRAIKEFGLPVVDSQVLDRGSQITLSCIGRYADSEEKANWDPHGALRKSIVQFLRQHLPCDHYSIKIGGTTSIDISEGTWNKENGMREVLRVTGTDAENAIFFGDSMDSDTGNDYPASLIVDAVEVTDPSNTLQLLEKYFPNISHVKDVNHL